MMATLPPFAELELKNLVHFTQSESLRASSDRPNLRYCVQSVSSINTGISREELLLDETTRICMQDMEIWRASAAPSGSIPIDRGICFVRTKSFGFKLADRLHAVVYHGNLDQDELLAIIQAWCQGHSSLFIVATSSLSAGMHYASLRRVIHIDAPDGLLSSRDWARGSRQIACNLSDVASSQLEC